MHISTLILPLPAALTIALPLPGVHAPLFFFDEADESEATKMDLVSKRSGLE